MKRGVRLALEHLLYRKEESVYAERPREGFRVMTYNVRCDAEADGVHNWRYRKRCVVDVIREESPTILCCQELYGNQYRYLMSELSGYDSYGVSAVDGRALEKGVKTYGLCIFYDDRYTLVDKGCLWLSDTPHKPSSTWGNEERRIAIYVTLKDEHGRVYHVYNTHFDHKSEEAVEESSKLIVDRVMGLDGEVFVAGDFNRPISELSVLNTAMYNNIEDTTGTFVGFRFQNNKVIDAIYTTKPYRHKVVVRDFNGHNASDHNAVVIWR